MFGQPSCFLRKAPHYARTEPATELIFGHFFGPIFNTFGIRDFRMFFVKYFFIFGTFFESFFTTIKATIPEAQCPSRGVPGALGGVLDTYFWVWFSFILGCFFLLCSMAEKQCFFANP